MHCQVCAHPLTHVCTRTHGHARHASWCTGVPCFHECNGCSHVSLSPPASPCREGTELPVLQIRLAAPAATGTHLRHSLRDAATRRVVFAGPPRQCSSGNSRRRSVQGGGESGGHGGGARAAGGVQAEGAVPLGALTGSELQGAVLWPPPMCGSRGSARAAEMEVAAQGALAFQQVRAALVLACGCVGVGGCLLCSYA